MLEKFIWNQKRKAHLDAEDDQNDQEGHRYGPHARTLQSFLKKAD